MSVHDFDWKAPGAVDQLKELWRSGHSASQIAAKMGLSRNAVIGKCQRLGLTAASRLDGVKLIRKTYTFIRKGMAVQDTMPPRARAMKAPKVARSHVRPPKPGPQNKPALVLGHTFVEGPGSDEARAAFRKDGLSIVERVVSGAGVESPNARPFIEAKSGCKWPIGERHEVRSCCNPIARGVYCDGHAAAAYAGKGAFTKRYGSHGAVELMAVHATRHERLDHYEATVRGPRAKPEPTLWDEGREAA